MVFPTWFTVEDRPQAAAQTPVAETRRRMVEFEHLQTRGDRLSYVDPASGKRLGVNPIRFVGACAKGHLEDIDWRGLVHRSGDRNCRKSMFWVERGVSSDPSDISVQCTCGIQVTMADLYKPKFPGTCRAFSPWLMPRYVAGESCTEDLRLLPRSATNTYFAQTVTVISLTRTDDRVRQTIEEHRQMIESIRSLPNFIQVLRTLPQTKEPFAPFSDQEITTALATLAEGDGEHSTNPRVAEFDVLASGAPTIGYDEAGAFLFAETLDRAALALSTPGAVQSPGRYLHFSTDSKREELHTNIADVEPTSVDTRSPRSSLVLRASQDVSGTRMHAWQAAPCSGRSSRSVPAW